MSSIPERSYVQRMDALAKGNAVRKAHATYKKFLKSGEVSAAELIRLGADGPVPAMTVYAVLKSQRAWAHLKASRALSQAGVDGTRKLRSLTEAQKERLLDQL